MIEVHFKMLNGPNVQAAMDGMISRVEKLPSLEVTSFGVGSPSWFPSTTDAHLTFGKLASSEANRIYAENAVRAANGAGVFSAAWDFYSTAGTEVVAASAASGAAAVQKTGEALAENAKGIGQGIGFGIVVLAAVAGFLYLRGVRA